MATIIKKEKYEIKSKAIFDDDYDKDKPDDITDRFEYVGHIDGTNGLHREFIIIKCLKTDEHYLNVFAGAIKENYLIKININNKNEIQQTVDRYNVNKRIKGFSEGIGLFEMNRQRSEVEQNFSLPETVDDNNCGWHSIIRAVGECKSIDRVAQLENGLVFNNCTNTVFIKQMTACHSTEPVTIIETAYSDGLLVFFFNQEQSSLFVMFYFQGDTINDVPVDMKVCVDTYGIYEVEMK